MADEQFIPIVSTENIPGYRLKEFKGLVWASSVRSKFFLQDISALFRMLLGGEIPEYMELTNEARQEVLDRLNENAKKLGANAVVAVELLSVPIVPGAIEILAYGTAVVAEKI